MEDQRRDIGKGVWFLALLFYSLVFSVLGQSEPSMTLRVSPNMTVQQEGTTVSLLCLVSAFNTATHFVSWFKKEPSYFFIATSKDLSVSDEQYHVSFTDDVISIFDLTISQVKATARGTYECNLIMQIDETKSRVVLEEELDLLVYPRDAFPSCSPNGPAAITAGSSLSCLTSGNATPSINGENDDWTYYIGVNGSGAVRSKIVTFSDNSQTYVCVAEIPGSDTRLSCTIGPLKVVSPTILPKTSTTVLTPTVVPPGLSAGEITGIVIGAIVLIIIIAVHTLCCRCDPRRWIHAKDYITDCGRSKETSKEISQAHEDTSRSPPDVVMRSQGDDVPPSYSSVMEEHSVDVSQSDRLKGAKSTLAGAPDPPQQTPQIYAQVNKRRGNNTDASGDISQTTTGKPEQAARKPKKFARRDEVPVEVELGSSKTVVYADLDLEKEGQDEIKQLGKPQETLYADIQM